MRWIARIVLVLVAALLAAFAWLGIPATAAGMVAKNVCSGVFVAGRSPADVLAADVLPASLILRLVEVDVDHHRRQVAGRMLWSGERVAMQLPGLGCVLEPTPDLLKTVSSPAQARPQAAKVEGLIDSGSAAADAGSGGISAATGRIVDRAALDAVVDALFGVPGTPGDTGTRAVVILHRGDQVAERYAAGFDAQTPQTGWSMSKTVLGLLVHQKLKEQGREPTIRALDWVAPARRPAWLAAWENDARGAMTIEDLLLMRDGLDHEEGYAPWSAVPRMLWGSPDITAFAGSAPAEVPPGSRFRYLSATTNILSALLRAQFPDDAAYWGYPQEALFTPIGAHSAVLESDASGNFVGSSYLWATPRDWARIGEVLRRDGLAGDRRVFAAGWQRYASNPPAIDDAAAAGYGAQVWLAGAARASTCGPDHGLPADTLMMAGHWGQVVAVVPSREAVIVRLGLTPERERFSRCAFIRSVLAALPGEAGATGNSR